MYENNKDEVFDEIDISEFFSIIKIRIRWIMTMTIIVGILSGFVSWFFIENSYQAESTIIISSHKNESDIGTITFSDYNLGLQLVESYRILIKTDKVLSQVIEQTALNLTVEELAKKIEVEAQSDTEIIKIAVSDRNPATAQVIANVLVDIFQKEVIEIMKMDNVQVIDYAKLPLEPVKPNRPLNVLVSMVAGFIVATIIAVIIALMDTTIKTTEQVERILKVTTIGTVPPISANKRRN